MSENLFQPMYLLRIALIAMIIVWSREAWKLWCRTPAGIVNFKKIMHKFCLPVHRQHHNKA